jgi:hypothetical protein
MYDDQVHKINVRAVTLLGQPTSTKSILSIAAETPSSTSSFTILGYYTPAPSSVVVVGGTDHAATSPSKSSSKTPIIVGATVGGIVFLLIVGFLAWFLLRRWRGTRPYSGPRGTTPMLRRDIEEKREMRETPDSGASRGVMGGIFPPFGGQCPHSALMLCH